MHHPLRSAAAAPLPVRLILHLLVFSFVISCRSPQVTGPEIMVTITADGTTRTVTVSSGSTVTQAFQSAGIVLGNLDRTSPAPYTVLKNGDVIELTRVKEEFETEEQTVPFERQVVRNCLLYTSDAADERS